MNENDEEVVTKGSPLYQYLVENDLNDFEVNEMALDKPKMKKKVDETAESYISHTEVRLTTAEKMIYKSFVEQILCSQLLLSDDSDLLEMSAPPEVDNVSCKSYKREMIEITYLTLSSAIMWRFRNPFVQMTMLTPALTYFSVRLFTKFKQYLFKREFDQFFNLIKNLHKTFKNTMKIIRDYSVLIVGSPKFTNDQEKLSMIVQHLEKSTAIILREVIVTLNQCTSNIVKAVSVNIPYFFESLSNIQPHEENDLDKLYLMFLLTQSECLRVLGLCYCVQFWQTNTHAQVKYMHKYILPKTSKQINEAYLKAIHSFKLFRSIEHKKRPFLNANKVQRPQHDIYINVYQMTLQLHSSLNKSWDVIAQLETELDEEQCKEIDKTFDSLITEFKSLEEYLSICRIQLTKIQNNFHKKETSSILPSTSASIQENLNDTKVVDLSKEENKPIDQIFELYVRKDDEAADIETVPYDEPLNKDEKKATKLVLKELEKVLVFKREEWEQREAKIRELQSQQNGGGYDPTNSELSCEEIRKTSAFRHKMKKSDNRQSESSSSEDVEHRNHDQNSSYFGPRSTVHILPHPRRISKYKNVRDKVNKQKINKLAPLQRESNESNDDSDINIPQHPIGLGQFILPPIPSTFRQDEESLSAVGELSDSDSERK